MNTGIVQYSNGRKPSKANGLDFGSEAVNVKTSWGK